MVPVGPVIARVRVALERAEVWKLVATEEGRESWLPGFTFGEGLGSDVQFQDGERVLDGTIDVWVEGHVLGWKWARTDEAKHTAPLITLRSTEQGTAVTVTETGFDVLGAGASQAKAAQTEWDAALERLVKQAGTVEASSEDTAVVGVDQTAHPAETIEPTENAEAGAAANTATEVAGDTPEVSADDASDVAAEIDEDTVAVAVVDNEAIDDVHADSAASESEPVEAEVVEPAEADESASEYDFDSDDGVIEGESADELEPLMEAEVHTNTGVISLVDRSDENTDANTSEVGLDPRESVTESDVAAAEADADIASDTDAEVEPAEEANAAPEAKAEDGSEPETDLESETVAEPQVTEPETTGPEATEPEVIETEEATEPDADADVDAEAGADVDPDAEAVPDADAEPSADTGAERQSPVALVLPEPPKDWQEQRDPSLYTAQVETIDTGADTDTHEDAELNGEEVGSDFAQLLREATVHDEPSSDTSPNEPGEPSTAKRPWWRRR